MRYALQMLKNVDPFSQTPNQGHTLFIEQRQVQFRQNSSKY